MFKYNIWVPQEFEVISMAGERVWSYQREMGSFVCLEQLDYPDIQSVDGWN